MKKEIKFIKRNWSLILLIAVAFVGSFYAMVWTPMEYRAEIGRILNEDSSCRRTCEDMGEMYMYYQEEFECFCFDLKGGDPHKVW